MKSFARVISSLAGIGYLPASGTAASVLTAVLYFYLLGHIAWYYQLVLLVAVTLVATGLSHIVIRDSENKDPSEIVIDEFVGMWIALIFVPKSIPYILLILILFRVLDIVKPGPIGWIDKNVSGGWGVMCDDILAGVLCIPVSLALHLV